MFDVQASQEATGTSRTPSLFTIPNALSVSRVVAAVALMFAAPLSMAFWILYAWCGVSDIVDGPIARHQGNASNFGATLDAVGDVTLAVALIVVFFPAILAMGQQGTIALLLALCCRAMVLAMLARGRGPEGLHSTPARALGIFLFACPIAVAVWGFAPVFLIACTVTVIVSACEAVPTVRAALAR